MILTEFQSITLIENIPSILQHGIVSYSEAAKLPHLSVALQEVQDRRDAKRVLIPKRIPPDFIFGAYVAGEAAKGQLEACGFRLPVEGDPDLFFH